jgi:hypothetical protein
MSKRSMLFGIAVVGVVLFPTTTQAQATKPTPACQDTIGRRIFAAGWLQGANLTGQTWSGVNDCDGAVQFESVLLAALRRNPLPANPSQKYVLCRYAGFVTGILESLDTVYASCSWTCQDEGRLVGEIAAVAYCELLIATAGLASPTDLLRGPQSGCGCLFAPGCDATFTITSRIYENYAGTCLPYTIFPFDQVWNQVISDMCASWCFPPPKLMGNEEP